MAVIPEFVTSVALLLVFALWLDWLPVSARWPPGTSGLEQIKYLILPATALVLLLFGYIARMARAGTIDALRSDYVRTAVVKGLPRGTVVRRHVLRNSLIPTIAVIATQIGYMIGGLVVDRADLQLQRPRLHAAAGRPEEGLPAAAVGDDGGRRRVPGRHAVRRPADVAAQPAHPLRAER